MFFAYILKSKGNNQIYIGSTKNLRRRIVEHNKGKEISTRRYLPWELLYYEAYQTESLARGREKRLKYNGNALREVKKRIGIFGKSGKEGLPSTTFLGKSGAGFTILEVTLAIFILTCGVVGSFALIQQTLSSITVSQSKLIASYLAQEGMETVKNIRDSNWLAQRVDSNVLWDEGLAEGSWQIDFKNQTLPYDSRGHFLNIDSNGFYSYSVGSATVFKRKISFSEKTDLNEDGSPDKMKVLVQVIWEERGRSHSVEAIDYLYNWYGSKEEKSEVCHLDGVPQTYDGAEATALDCYAGQEACRRCVSGVCTYYTSGQHDCDPGYECNINGQCVEVEQQDVCAGIPDNTQVSGCDGPCQACQGGACGFADAGTDPGSDCTGAYSCSGFTTRLKNMCDGSGSCADIDAAAPDCSGTCASYCSGGDCIDTDTGIGTCVISTDARVASGGDGYCSNADCIIWNLGYNYRKSVTISNSNADYQMKLTVNKGTGIDSGSTVYLNGHALSWTGTVPNDIRFTGSDGTSQLYYWIESSDANTATIWVRNDSVPSTTIYVYYGKSADTTISNGGNTFVFFDDFNDGSINTAEWDIGGAPTESGTALLINTVGEWVRSKNTYNYKAFRVRADIPPTNYTCFGFNSGSSPWDTTNVAMWVNTNVPSQYSRVGDAASFAQNAESLNTAGAYHIYEMLWQNGSVKAYVDDVYKREYTSYVPTGDIKLLFSESDASGNLYIDWVFARNYTSPEPTWETWGSEE